MMANQAQQPKSNQAQQPKSNETTQPKTIDEAWQNVTSRDSRFCGATGSARDKFLIIELGKVKVSQDAKAPSIPYSGLVHCVERGIVWVFPTRVLTEFDLRYQGGQWLDYCIENGILDVFEFAYSRSRVEIEVWMRVINPIVNPKLRSSILASYPVDAWTRKISARLNDVDPKWLERRELI